MTLTEIEAQLPWGFHDAYLERIEVDNRLAQVTLELRVAIAEHQETNQLCRVRITGVHFFVALPPAYDAHNPPAFDEVPWIDAGEGRIKGDNSPLPPVPEGCFLHHFLTYDWWQYFYVCAKNAEFTWLEPSPVPTKSARRALYPGEDVKSG